MATFSAVTRQHILQAISEYDDRGGEAFLGVYGFQPSKAYTFVYEGRRYDSKAILGVAHKYATGRVATADEFSGGQQSPAPILRKHGFEATGLVHTPAPPKRAQAASTRHPAVPERVMPICPTCSMTLPATGVCDDCG